MGHIAAGRVDHISSEPSAEFPIAMTPKEAGPTEYATVEYAVDRLVGYYDLDPDEIAQALRAGAPMQTMGYHYRLAKED